MTADWRARFGGEAPALDVPSAVIESLLAHRSVRAFTSDPVLDDTLAWLVGAAQSAATSSNMQAWSVVAVREPARKARLAALCGNQDFIAEAPLFLLWIADLSRATRIGAAHEAPLDGLQSFEALLVAIVDAALAAQNLAAAAESVGLGIVYVGAARNRPQDVAAELGLPPRCFAVFGMAVGTPDPARPAAIKPRLGPDAVLHRERYETGGETAALAAYDARLLAFRAQEGLSPLSWTQRVVQRWATVGVRRHLKAVLQGFGFGGL